MEILVQFYFWGGNIIHSVEAQAIKDTEYLDSIAVAESVDKDVIRTAEHNEKQLNDALTVFKRKAKVTKHARKELGRRLAMEQVENAYIHS